MKRTSRLPGLASLLFLLVLLFLPLSASGQDKSSYISLRPGAYFFTGDLDDLHPHGFYSEFAYGYYVLPVLVIEGAAGYFHDGVNYMDNGVSQGNDIAGAPVLISLKGVYQAGGFEAYAGGGAGVYFTWYQGWRLKGVRVFDARDTVYGGHIMAGANFDFSPNLFTGFEARYVFTEKADYSGARVNLDGVVALVGIGMRF
ncbi:MAG TPA: hypothetical protein VJM57_02585 [Thermodesulfobacteriota bacterium]|nr:hypothetical protein [Thermodesulfobacteriota bacterium]